MGSSTPSDSVGVEFLVELDLPPTNVIEVVEDVQCLVHSIQCESMKYGV